MSYFQKKRININDLAEDTSPDEANDFLVSYDASAGSNKKVKPDNVQPKVTSATGTLPIANGGTGQTSQTAAFDALDPLTTQGDIIHHNGTNSVRLGIGSTGQQLSVSSGDTAWADPATVTAGGFNFVVKSSTQSAVMETATAITELTLSVSANKMYYFIFRFNADLTTAASGGLNFSIDGPTGATFVILNIWESLDSINSGYIEDTVTAFTTAPALPGASWDPVHATVIEGIVKIGSTAGTLQGYGRSANITPDTNMNVYDGSFLMWRLLN